MMAATYNKSVNDSDGLNYLPCIYKFLKKEIIICINNSYVYGHFGFMTN